MEHRPLGRSGLRPSALGLGALHFGVFLDRAASVRLVHKALDAGVTLIDTAPMYGQGRSEAFVGKAVRGRRGDVIIATKVGLEPSPRQDGSMGVRVVPLSRERIRLSLERSLKDLGTDYVDLFQVHAFDEHTPVEETLGTLEELIREGKIRFAGCSNFSDIELDRSMAVARRMGVTGYASAQCHYNMIERRAGEALASPCRDHGVGIMCNRALARGILTGKYKPGHPIPEGSRAATSDRVRRWLDDSTLQLIDALVSFAADRGRTATELAIAWLLAQDNVSTVLVGTRGPEQLEHCVAGSAWRPSSEEISEIDSIINGMGLMPQVRSLPPDFLEK